MEAVCLRGFTVLIAIWTHEFGVNICITLIGHRYSDRLKIN